MTQLGVEGLTSWVPSGSAVSFEESDTSAGSCAADDGLRSAASGLILFESGVVDVTDSGNLDDSVLRLQFPFWGKYVSTSSIEICLEVGNGSLIIC